MHRLAVVPPPRFEAKGYTFVKRAKLPEVRHWRKIIRQVPRGGNSPHEP